MENDFQEIEVLTLAKGTMLTRIQRVKVDFLRFNYPTIRPLRIENRLRLLSPEDIAPMKFDAIAGRGKKKDFYDLYFLLEKMSLPAMLDLHREKFNLSTTFHIVKSLTYFEDAEDDDAPIPLITTRKTVRYWAKVAYLFSTRRWNPTQGGNFLELKDMLYLSAQPT